VEAMPSVEGGVMPMDVEPTGGSSGSSGCPDNLTGEVGKNDLILKVFSGFVIDG